MRSAHWLMAAVVTCSAAGGAWGLEGDGLVPPKNTPWPRWQGRLSLATTTPMLHADPMNADSSVGKLAGASVLSDYYFTRSLPRLGDSGGFRATSGMFLGTRSGLLLSTGPATGVGGRAFSIDKRTVGGLKLPGLPETLPDAGGAVPYVGLGYTGLPGKSGWGFSADLGVMALNPGSAVKLGRMQNLDDVLRDMRLSPLVQVGVSYSF
jgi:hypothetical protein